MLFKMKDLLVIALGLVLVSCSYSNKMERLDDADGIGRGLSEISLFFSHGQPLEKLAIFDKTVRKIHQFDLQQNKLEFSWEVEGSEQKHFVLGDPKGEFVIDFYQKNLTVIKSNGERIRNPVNMVGLAQSVAFDANRGLLVVMDELRSIAFLQLDSAGEVLNSWVGGSRITAEGSLQAGDLLKDRGILALALSNGSIVQVDVAESIKAKDYKLKAPPILPNLGRVEWLASLNQDSGDKILCKSENHLALLDLQTGAIEKLDVTGMTPVRAGKEPSPHIVFKDSSNRRLLTFSENGQILTREFRLESEVFILTSYLDLAKDQWTAVVVQEQYGAPVFWKDNSIPEIVGRKVVRFGLSQQVPQISETLENRTDIRILDDVLFSLFPSELGKAEIRNLVTGEKRTLRGFNAQAIGEKSRM